MFSTFVITLLVLSVAAARVFSPDIQHIMPRDSGSCSARQTAGYICESCELLSTCVRHSSGWVNIPVEECDTQNGYYCNVRLGMCSNQTGPCHPFAAEGSFPCTSPGIFPDPYDCQKYHMCYVAGPTLVSAPVECGSDKAFSAATGQCSLSLLDPVCQEKQFQCTVVGEAHPWPSNPNIFYICKALLNQVERVLYPTLYRCADGEHFDGYYCRSSGDSSTGLPSFPQPIGPGEGNHPGSGNDSSRLCRRVGLYADPADCHMYYYCSAVNGTSLHIKCPNGTYFNAPFASCSLGDCRNPERI